MVEAEVGAFSWTSDPLFSEFDSLLPLLSSFTLPIFVTLSKKAEKNKFLANMSGRVDLSLRNVLEDRLNLVLIGAAVVTVVILAWIANPTHNNLHLWAGLPNFLAQPIVLILLLLVGLVLAAVATGIGFSRSTGAAKILILVLFLVAAFLLLSIAFLIYRSGSYGYALVLAVVLLLGLLLHLALVAMVDRRLGYAVVPAVILAILIIWYLWNMGEAADAYSLVQVTPVYGPLVETSGAPVGPI